MANNRFIWIALALCLTASLGLQFQLRHPYPDSDQFYHFAVSRLTAEQGLLRTLPQVHGLQWDKVFPDKEFLFHMLTTAAHTAGEEKAIRLTAILLALSLVGTLYALCRTVVPSVIAALLSVGFLTLDPFFFQRMFLVRPHLLAVLLFLWIAIGICRKSSWQTFIAATLYALAYHAIHLPLLVLLIHLAGTLLSKGDADRAVRKCALLGVAGLLVGTLANPYFPEHLAIGWEHLLFAFENQDPAAPIGSELRRVPPLILIRRSPLLSAAVTLSLIASMFAVYQKNINLTKPIVVWSLCVAVFAVAALLNPRGLEYLIPLTALLLALHLQSCTSRMQGIFSLVFLLLLGLQSTSLVIKYFSSAKPSVNPGRLAAIQATRALPEDAAGKFVFNCTFNTGPYLLQYRPDVSFLDLLDPRLYRNADPENYKLRNLLVHGGLSDPHSVLRRHFKASYVICMRPGLLKQMNSDPQFERLYPKEPGRAAQVQSFRLLQ